MSQHKFSQHKFSQREIAKLVAAIRRSNIKHGYGSDIRAEITDEERSARVEEALRRQVQQLKEDRERYMIPEYMDVGELLSIPLE